MFICHSTCSSDAWMNQLCGCLDQMPTIEESTWHVLFWNWLTYDHISILYMYYPVTLNMLSCFKDYKRYINILNHTLDLVWPKYMKLTLEQQYMLSVLHSQYHAYWCIGDFRSQRISRHDNDPQSWNNLSSVSEELTHWGRVTHICVSKLTIIGSDNGLSPGRRQAIVYCLFDPQEQTLVKY